MENSLSTLTEEDELCARRLLGLRADDSRVPGCVNKLARKILTIKALQEEIASEDTSFVRETAQLRLRVDADLGLVNFIQGQNDDMLVCITADQVDELILWLQDAKKFIQDGGK